MMLEETFKESLKKYSLLKKKDKVILGVSGGPDSMGMLYQFWKIYKDYKLKLVCAHFNHGLRDEADREEEFTRGICAKLGIKFISEKKDVQSFFNGDSLEQTARNLRLDFFLKVSRQIKIKKIALAHHKDDLIETVLMRLVRGSGLKGLRGFLPKTKFKSLTIIRPLIELRKQEIIKWLEDKKIPYCIDKSNFEDKFFRNRLRLKLLPVLSELNPNIVNNIYNLAVNISWDYDFIRSFSYSKFRTLKKKEARNSLYLDLGGLKELAPAIFNNVIRIAIEELKGNTRRLESRHLNELQDLIFHRPSGSIVDLPNLLAKKEEETLFIQSLIL
ncbi:MAG: tRNA lysidine(34) synthetase TilS [Candidatus Omnitrophota bacterium]